MLDALRIEPGTPVRLRERSTGHKLGLDDKDTAGEVLSGLIDRLRPLQARLWAEARRSVLLVLQGLDASGKDGTIRRVFTGVNPQGCRVASFKAPAPHELARDYLWRVHAAVPARGEIGIFNRSHYEDVIVAAVTGVVDDHGRERRYHHIREFERMLHDEGTRVVKIFLHIGRDEQRTRLQRRLDDPEKRWKFRADDLTTRRLWDRHIDLYDAAIEATSTDVAPWYVVPADRKWVRDVAVATLLVETLADMDPQLPPCAPDLDGLRVD